MKDRVRESLFNILGPRVQGKAILDLFAGTGALGLEALSRGAAKCIFIERHVPTAKLVRENIAQLGLESQCRVLAVDTLAWARQPQRIASQMGLHQPWLTFCSPPYGLYLTQGDEVRGLLRRLVESAPARSLLVVEADERFDLATLPCASAWDIRVYPPARIAMYESAGESEEPLQGTAG